jgi:hypothetical protein
MGEIKEFEDYTDKMIEVLEDKIKMVKENKKNLKEVTMYINHCNYDNEFELNIKIRMLSN